MKKVISLMLIGFLLILTACSQAQQNTVKPDQSIVQAEAANPEENPAAVTKEDQQAEHSESPENSQTDTVKETETESTVGDYVILETKNTVKIKRYIGAASEVKIPELINEKPVTEIGDEAFDDKAIISLLLIPKSVTKIGRYAFSDTRWFRQALTDEFVIVGDGVLIKYNGKADKILVPNTVKSIGYNEVFAGCGMSEIVIPEGVVYLNEGAFSQCNNLQSIVIPDSVIYLGDYLFYKSSVTEITVPASVKEFGNGVFKTNSPVTIYGKKGSAIEKYIDGNDYFTFVAQ